LFKYIINTLNERNRRQLIVNISHDLKTPLTNIRGYSETILDFYKDLDKDLMKYLKISNKNSLKADYLLNDLFDLSKLDSDEYKINLVKADIAEGLRRFLIGYVEEFNVENIDYDINIEIDKYEMLLDSQLFKRAISNIINNSIKYLGNEEDKVIRVSLTKDENLVLVIEDNGPGIPREIREDIFKPFIMGNSSRHTETNSSGLGPSITKSIIEKMNGSIELDNGFNEGTRFIIRF